VPFTSTLASAGKADPAGPVPAGDAPAAAGAGGCAGVGAGAATTTAVPWTASINPGGAPCSWEPASPAAAPVAPAPASAGGTSCAFEDKGVSRCKEDGDRALSPTVGVEMPSTAELALPPGCCWPPFGDAAGAPGAAAAAGGVDVSAAVLEGILSL